MLENNKTQHDESILRTPNDEWMDDFEEYYGSQESDYYLPEELQHPYEQTPPLDEASLNRVKNRKPTPWKNLSPLYTITHFSDNGSPK